MKSEFNVHGIIVPHVPILLEDEMDQKPSKVITELRELGKRMKEWGIEAVVVADTHWQTGDRFFIDNSPFHQTETTYYGFRNEVEYDVPGHPELANLLQKAGEKNLVFPGVEKHGADHAITVPLHFMFPEKDVPVVPLSIAGTELCAFRWGRTIGKALRDWGHKTLFIASGCFSHDLLSFQMARFQAEHGEFDRQVIQLLTEGNGMDLPKIAPELIQSAKPEGNFRDLFMLMGLFGSETQGQIQAYETLPGVGMAVIEFSDSGYNENDDKWLSDIPSDGKIH
ncbi:MAG: hypothetical protein ACRKFN_04825 [Desulfitobacterium sp.]